MTRLIVLDLDGTLVRLDVDWPALRAELAALAGRPIARVHEALDDPRLEAAVTRAEIAGARRCEVNEALLDWLPAREAPVAMLSLNCPEAVRIASARAGVTPIAVIGRGDVERPKPAPEGLLSLARARGVAPRETLMIGDSATDLACAAAAGACGVHVTEIGVRWISPARAEPSSAPPL